MTILEAVQDPALWGHLFAGSTWRPWWVLLAATFGLPPPAPADESVALFRRCTGRATWPTTPARELWVISGRRSGKSRVAALIATYLAALRQHPLSPGERGVFFFAAPDMRQARIARRYTRALFDVPLLQPLVTRETHDSLELGDVAIEIVPSHYKSVRGFTLIGACLDEVAYLPTDESAAPDTELLAALRPALATVPGALLVAISSPFARRGELFRQYERYYGKDGDVLVWQSATRTMNENIPQRIIDDALDTDASVARSEWEGQFRSDLEQYITLDALRACVVPGRTELPPLPNTSYFAFCDPASGTPNGDSFPVCIAHRERDGRLVIDVLKEHRPPFDPLHVVGDIVSLLRSYRITALCGDRYAGAWPTATFARFNITYRPSERNRSELYIDALASLTGRQVELLDHPRMLAQFQRLERRTNRSGTGKDIVDHPPGAGQHDDCSNVVAGVLAQLATRRPLAFGFMHIDLP